MPRLSGRSSINACLNVVAALTPAEKASATLPVTVTASATPATCSLASRVTVPAAVTSVCLLGGLEALQLEGQRVLARRQERNDVVADGGGRHGADALQVWRSGGDGHAREGGAVLAGHSPGDRSGRVALRVRLRREQQARQQAQQRLDTSHAETPRARSNDAGCGMPRRDGETLLLQVRRGSTRNEWQPTCPGGVRRSSPVGFAPACRTARWRLTRCTGRGPVTSSISVRHRRAWSLLQGPESAIRRTGGTRVGLDARSRWQVPGGRGTRPRSGRRGTYSGLVGQSAVRVLVMDLR